MLEREHAVKVEALCVLKRLNICVLMPLYMCPHRSEIAVLETEHAVKVMLITKPLKPKLIVAGFSSRFS